MTKKSQSTAGLKPKLSQESQELTSQLATTQEKLNSLQTRLQGHEPSLLLKARSDLIAIRQQLTQLFPDSQAKPSELLEQLISQQRELIDQNNELRLQSLKAADALKISQQNEDEFFAKYKTASQLSNQLKLQIAKLQQQLTLDQQDLKSAQQIIELRLNKPINQPNYWKRISLVLVGVIAWLWLKETNHD